MTLGMSTAWQSLAQSDLERVTNSASGLSDQGPPGDALLAMAAALSYMSGLPHDARCRTRRTGVQTLAHATRNVG